MHLKQRFSPLGVSATLRHLADKLIGVLSALYKKSKYTFYEILTIYKCIEK